MNKQAIETEYKRICDKLGFIPKEFKPLKMFQKIMVILKHFLITLALMKCYFYMKMDI